MLCNMIFQLDPDDISFPDPALSEENGLLAVEGDLSVPRLLNAYMNGIFPWYEDDEFILWWSLDPRMILYPKDFRYSKSLRRTVRSGRYEVRIDTCFEAVMRACGSTARRDQDGTWVTEGMVQAYVALHREGFAHSFETFRDGQLVGGLYGVSLGDIFVGESMFHTERDTSKVAFVRLVEFAAMHGFRFIDAQQESKHLASLGARPVPRADYLDELAATPWPSTLRGRWQRNTAALLLGGNQGNRELLLSAAVQLLAERAGTVACVSNLCETAPWGFASQQNFLNMAVVLDTDLSANALLHEVLQIEQQLGRQRDSDPLAYPTRPQDKQHYSDRPIDIDIIFFNSDIIDIPTLQVPHPRMQERRFVLVPLCEVMPDFVHPSLHKTMVDLLKCCPDKGEVNNTKPLRQM